MVHRGLKAIARAQFGAICCRLKETSVSGVLCIISNGVMMMSGMIC